MNIIESLQNMDAPQLLQLAKTQGVKVHPKSKPETIRKAIIDNMSHPPKVELKHPAEAPKRPVDHNTPEDVEAALAALKAKVPEFKADYDLDANTWYFRCKGAEECGNLNIPLRVILMKARTVSRGRLALYGMNDHFDKTVASGKSAYTNTVLGV